MGHRRVVSVSGARKDDTDRPADSFAPSRGSRRPGEPPPAVNSLRSLALRRVHSVPAAAPPPLPARARHGSGLLQTLTQALNRQV